MSWFSSYPNRTMCDVLTEMREAYNTRNFSYQLGLIEEAQSMANRMEAALHDIGDLKQLGVKLRKRKKEYKELERKLNDLQEKTGTEQTIEKGVWNVLEVEDDA